MAGFTNGSVVVTLASDALGSLDIIDLITLGYSCVTHIEMFCEEQLDVKPQYRPLSAAKERSSCKGTLRSPHCV